MRLESPRLVLALLVGFAAGAAASAAIGSARAEPPASTISLDRQQFDRLVRAHEAEVRAIEGLTRVTERCSR